MAEKQGNPGSGPNRNSQQESERAAGAQQRKRSAGSGTPGRDEQTQSDAHSSSRRGEDRAGAHDVDERQDARGESLLRGDEVNDVDQPGRDH